MKQQSVKPVVSPRRARPAQRQDDLSGFLRTIVADAVSRMAVIDSDLGLPHQSNPSTWQARRA